MEVNRVRSSRDDSGCGGNEGSGSPDGAFIDRGKVKILLCDKDPESCQSVMSLLCKCSYQVTSVRSARQVVDALSAEGPNIDIILLEADLPTGKGMKLLKHITRDENLRRIPVIMDEVSLVFKSLRLGAADFLVKPLRTNELLNLWTHMWRRRRMLGLEEKNILSSDGGLTGSNVSSEDTNSITLLSDGTDNKFTKNAGSGKGPHQDDETSFAAEFSSAIEGTAVAFIACGTANIMDKSANATLMQPGDMYYNGVKENSHNQSGPSFFSPKKSKLNIGNSSAFFTYSRSCPQDPTTNLKECDKGGSLAKDNSESFPCSSSVKRSQIPHIVLEHLHRQYSTEDEPPNRPSYYADEPRANMPGFGPHSVHSYLMPGKTNLHFKDTTREGPPDSPSCCANEPQANMPGFVPRSAHSYLTPGKTSPHFQGTTRDEPLDKPTCHVNEPQANMFGFNTNAPYPYLTQGMTDQMMMPHYYLQFNQSFVHYPPYMPPMMMPYPSAYPSRVSLQPGHIPNTTPLPDVITNHHTAPPVRNFISKRQAALIKFRRKRNMRSFEKKIRYVNRKNLAESRPRVKGQFVSKSASAAATDGFSTPNKEGEEEEDSGPTTQDFLAHKNRSDQSFTFETVYLEGNS